MPKGAPTPLSVPEKRESKQATRDTVMVTVLVTPWADVYIDDKLLGRAPVKDLPLKVGKHRLRIVNPELDVNYEVVKEVEPTNEKVVFNYELN